MKYIKQKILLFVLLLAMAMPVSVYAAGEGNIDNGGGGMGAGTGTNFWSSHDEGVRVTVIRASDLKTFRETGCHLLHTAAVIRRFASRPTQTRKRAAGNLTLRKTASLSV